MRYGLTTGADSPTSPWAAPTSDPRALERASSSTDRIAAAVYSGQSAGDSFTIDINLTDGQAHQLALYALDWDSAGRREVITVNGQSAVLSSDFSQGAWVSFPVSVAAGGTVSIVVQRTAGPNAVLSGIFLG